MHTLTITVSHGSTLLSRSHSATQSRVALFNPGPVAPHRADRADQLLPSFGDAAISSPRTPTQKVYTTHADSHTIFTELALVDSALHISVHSFVPSVMHSSEQHRPNLGDNATDTIVVSQEQYPARCPRDHPLDAWRVHPLTPPLQKSERLLSRQSPTGSSSVPIPTQSHGDRQARRSQ